jgi:hypothetical protein
LSRGGFGRAVVDGVVNYTSPSALATADPSQDGGCPRKWWYKYVKRIKEPSSKAQQTGIAGHDEVDTYLTTGDDVLGTHARKIRAWIPEPGDDLVVEHRTEPGELVVEGVQLNMRLDLAHRRGEYVTPGGELVSETFPNVAEVLDWKFTGNLAYAKAPDTSAMVLYGKWALQRWPDIDWVRLSLVYASTRKREGLKTTRLLRRDDVTARVEQKIAPVVRNIKALALVTDPEHAPPNTRACDAFGGCHYRKIGLCDAGQEQGLVDFLGITAARKLLGGEKDMAGSLLDTLRPEVADKMAELEAAEAGVATPDPFADAVRWIESLGVGFPQTGGEAAREVGRVRGLEVTGAGLSGTVRNGWSPDAEGDAAFSLHKLAVTRPDQITGLHDELAAAGYAPPQAAAAGGGGELLPPGNDALLAPEQAPAPAPAPAEAVDAPEPAPAQEEPALPSDTSDPDPGEVAASTPTAPGPTSYPIWADADQQFVGDALEALRSARCSPDKRKAAAAALEGAIDKLRRTPTGAIPVDVSNDALASAAEEIKQLRAQIAELQGRQAEMISAAYDDGARPTSGLQLFVDALIVRAPGDAKPLDPYLDDMSRQLADAAGLADIRGDADKGPMAFGRWKAAVVAWARENPPPDGIYYLDTRGREIAAELAEALRPQCAYFARGIR